MTRLLNFEATYNHLMPTMKQLYIFAICVIAAGCASASAQQQYTSSDSTVLYANPGLNRLLDIQRNLSDFVFKDESSLLHRKPSFRILPSIKRTPGYGFSFGLGGAISFFTDRDDYSLQRSEVPLIVSVAFTKPFSYSIACEPQLYLAGNALRLQAEISYRDWLEYYFGVGYAVNHNPAYEKDKYTYESMTMRFKPNVQFRLGNPFLYGGIVADVWHERMRNPEEFVKADKHYLALTGNEIENIPGSSVRVVQLNTRGRTEFCLHYGRRLADMYVADERFFLKLLDLGCFREAIPHEQFLITHGG